MKMLSTGARELTKADLVEQLLEPWVGAERVSHALDLQVDEAVHPLPVGAVQEAEGFVLLPQPDVDGCQVEIRNVFCFLQILKHAKRLARLGGVSGDGLCVAVGHHQERSVSRNLPRTSKRGDRLGI